LILEFQYWLWKEFFPEIQRDNIMVFKEKEYITYLDTRGIDPETRKAYMKAVKNAIQYFEGKGLRFEDAGVPDFKEYIGLLMERGENTENNIVGVARYVYMLDMKDVWIYFASILGGRNIFPSIAERLEEIAGEETAKAIFSNVKAPPLGSKPEKYCDTTSNLMKEFMDNLSPEVYHRVLAGNHHRIPREAFEKHKQWLVEEGNVEAWLKRMHDAAVAELEEFLREDKVWYEQVITPDIVDYVQNNQEILSGVRVGEWIYNTKFPYAPQDYLDEKDPLMKRYYMCHCPLARESVLTGESDIPMDWCYCSAGYGKLRYDIAFGEETEVEVLESVFSSSDMCRFRIKIPEKWR
jgi:hypothetical protein